MEGGTVLGKRGREGEDAAVVKEVLDDVVVKKTDEEVREEVFVETTDDAAAPASMEVDPVLSVETVFVEVVLPTFVEEGPDPEAPAEQEAVAGEAEKEAGELKLEADLGRRADGIAATDVMEEEVLKSVVEVVKEEVKVVSVEGKEEEEVIIEAEVTKEEVKVVDVDGKEVSLEAEAKKEEVKRFVEGEQEKEAKVVAEEKQEPIQLGPKTFQSGVEMFTYFYDLLHAWVANIDVNKYEYMVLSDLISKGHRDAGSKIGPGIKSFQVRFHPGWHSRCYYLVRVDGSIDDFSYRKCVDKIMPLPESLFSTSGDLIVERLFGPQENKWAKKAKVKGGFEGGGGGGRGNHSRGGRNSHGGRRGGGRGGGHWNH